MAWLRTKTLFNIARHLWSRTRLRLCKRRTLNCLSSINKLKALNLVSSAALCQQEARFMWRIKRNNKQKQFLWLKNWIEEIDEQLCFTNAGNIRKQNTSCKCYVHLSVMSLLSFTIVFPIFETFEMYCLSGCLSQIYCFIRENDFKP